MAAQITKSYGGFLFIDPSASVNDVAAAILPTGITPAGTAFPCRITTERKRVFSAALGKRITQDWNTAHFVLWVDGRGSPDLGRAEARSIFLDAKANGVDAIVVHGRVSLIASPNISFYQFGVRDLALVPDAAAA